MKLPIEIIEVIVGYLKDCPDYMHARQVDRQFRYACSTDKFEAKFAKFVSQQLCQVCSFKALLNNEPGLLWLRRIKNHMSPFTGTLKIDDNTYLWTNEHFPMKRDDICIWGIAIDAKYIRELSLNCSDVHGQLIIVRKPNNKDGPFERVFATDISVPGNKLYRVNCQSWVEYVETAPIPFKYICFASQDFRVNPSIIPVRPLIRMVDVWHNKRLDIDLNWDETPRLPTCRAHFIAVTFSRYGLLLITCCRNATKFLVVGMPQYLGLTSEVDMSQLFDYFHYMISRKLVTLVDMGHDYRECDGKVTIFDGPEYSPLVKENWFCDRNMLFHVPLRGNVPTYRQFLAKRTKANIRCDNKIVHMFAVLDMNNYDCPTVTPDVRISMRHSLAMGAPFCDNMFIFCSNRHGNSCGVIDARPSALDFTITSGKVKVLKLPKDTVAGYLDDYILLMLPNDGTFYYHKLDVSSLLYDLSNANSDTHKG